MREGGRAALSPSLSPLLQFSFSKSDEFGVQTAKVAIAGVNMFLEGIVYFVIAVFSMFLAYAMVTWAFTQAPIALVTALREVSIVFALLIGVIFLKERLNVAKIISTMLTLAGVILLRISKT